MTSLNFGQDSPAALLLAFVCLFMSSCADFRYVDSNDESQPVSYVFEIDGESYFLDLPDAPNSVISDNVTVISARIQGPFEDVLLSRYDMVVNQRLKYEGSILTFGLTRSGCCSIRSAAAFERDRSPAATAVETVRIAGIPTVRSEGIEPNGDKLLRYQILFNSAYNIYFNLRIIDELLDRPDVVGRRIQMTDQTVRSFIETNVSRL